MIKLNDTAIQVIKDDRPLFIKLQSMFGVTEKTMYNYLNGCSQQLVTIDSVNTIVEHTGRPLSELIEGGKVSKLLVK